MAGLLKFIGRSVSDLMELGYPESVAKRISSGELHMDYESRMRRAAEQGYDVDNPEYRGGGLTQISDAEALFDNGFFSSQNPYVANTYSMMIGGNLMPVAIRKDGYLPVDAKGVDWNEIQVIDGSPLQQELLNQGYRGAGQIDTDQILNIARQAGMEGVSYENVRDIGGNTNKLGKKFLAKAWDGANNTASTNPENVKSLLSAAFDPEYTGSNILGSRMAPTAGAGLLGILGLTEKDLEDLK